MPETCTTVLRLRGRDFGESDEKLGGLKEVGIDGSMNTGVVF